MVNTIVLVNNFCTNLFPSTYDVFPNALACSVHTHTHVDKYIQKFFHSERLQ